MNTPPPPSRALQKEPSRIEIEKNEWRKHAEKVQARESKRNGDDKKNGNGSKKDGKPESHNRKLHWQRGKLQLEDEDGASSFPKNEYHSTHYTWWNFIPKNLYEQFRRFTNLYAQLLVTVASVA